MRLLETHLSLPTSRSRSRDDYSEYLDLMRLFTLCLLTGDELLAMKGKADQLKLIHLGILIDDTLAKLN